MQTAPGFGPGLLRSKCGLLLGLHATGRTRICGSVLRALVPVHAGLEEIRTLRGERRCDAFLVHGSLSRGILEAPRYDVDDRFRSGNHVRRLASTPPLGPRLSAIAVQ